MRIERGEIITNNWRRNDIVQYKKQIAEAKALRGQESLQIVRTKLRRTILIGPRKH